MLQTLRKRLNRKDEGFTLIELMVVVLIIAILLAIAIPTFLGARSRAQNRAAESILRNALTAEKTVYTDSQAYSASTSSMTTAEPSLSWLTSGTPLAASNQVYVATGDTNNEVCVYSKSAAGNMYGIIDVANTDSTLTTAGTFYYKNTSGTAPTCAGAMSDETQAGAASTTSGAGW